MNSLTQPIRFAVIGASRGKTFIKSTKELCGRAELVAICDVLEDQLEPWKEIPGIRLYQDYQQVLDDPEIDAVCIATPLPLHAPQAIAAMNADKHVLSEVAACSTLDEAWELIATVERTGMTYMMAENYCFSQPIMQVQNMVEQGVFGEIIYASGSYIHDCRDLFFTREGGLTWRGRYLGQELCNGYPTHSLGPVARWLGINQRDRFRTAATWHARRGTALGTYAERNHPAHAEYADPDYWSHWADTSTTSIRTEQGILVETRFDAASPRPHHMTRYELQGTKASFAMPDGMGGVKQPLIWIEGRSPTSPTGVATGWEPLSQYRDEYDHPWWKEFGEAAIKAGHGGGDFFILREFVSAIEERRAPLIDVYDAVTWSSFIPLSAVSIREGNAPVEIPDFAASRPRS